MATQASLKKLKKTPKKRFESNNVEPLMSKEYEAAWKLEYEKLGEVEKRVIDNAKTDSVHGVYSRHYFVDTFVKRVVDLVEKPVVNE